MRSWLNSRLLSSLRTRLILLVLLAVVPALGLILYTASEQRRTAITEAQENTLRLARLAANNQQQAFDVTRQLLMILAQLPIVRQNNSAECNQFLADTLKQHSTYANFAVLDSKGNVICSGIPDSVSVNLADRNYFQRAVQTRKFAVGNYQVGRLTQKATINFAYPVLSKAGQVQTVVVAALNLPRLNQLAAQVQMPPGSVLSVVDNTGKFLVRYPDSEKWIGKSLPPDAFKKMKTGREGVYEVDSLDGVRRVFAFVPLGENLLQPDAYVRIGIPTSPILSEANGLLIRNLASLGSVTILALIAAWVGGDVFFLRQIKSLAQTAQTLGSGQLNARTGLSPLSGELGQLAQAIDDMAAALEAREVALASLNQDMETLFELIPIGIIITPNLKFQQVRANPAFAEILGVSPKANASYTPASNPSPSYKILRDGKELLPEEFPLRYAALNNVEVKGTEVDIVRGDGQVFNLFGYAAPLVDEQNNPRGAVAAFLDITERKLSEERTRLLMSQVQHQANILNAILSASVDHIFIFDLDGRYQYVSENGAAVFGWNPEEMVGKTWQELDFASETAATMQRLDSQRKQVMATGQPIRAETEYNAADGLHCYEYILAPLYNREPAMPSPNKDVAHSLLPRRGAATQTTNAGVIAVSRDITNRKRTEQALRQSEQRLRLAQRAGKIGTWEWNLLTDEVSWSEGIWDILGLEVGTEEPSLKSWVNFLHPDDRSPVMAKAEKALAQSQKYYDEFRIVRKDGTVVWLASKGQILRDAEGQAERFLGVNIDISKRKQAEEEREELLVREQAAREVAETANRIKDEFLAVLSHELRTPLNPILGWVRLLRTRQLDDEKKAIALETIERNAQLQTQLIGDLLDVSRILQGKLTLNVSQVDLAATIAAAKETVRLAAEAKSIQIHTDIAPDVQPFMGDASRLQQVVWNLLSNAVKFTPTGGEVTVKLETNPTYIQLQVSDTGKGITPEFLPYVFETFRQADSATTRKFGGLGLGLAIVRHIVEMHGGTVGADSLGEDQGATFTVKLPFITTVAQTNPKKPLAKNSLNLRDVRVLTVEDEQDTRDFLVFMIQQYGAEVTAAASAKEALAILQQSQPDILVCDIGMPEMDGNAFIREVRTWPKEQGGEIKAIALTAYAGESNQQQAIAAGFQKHLSKPVNPEELVEAIASLITVNSNTVSL